jgi:hypothetical protein
LTKVDSAGIFPISLDSVLKTYGSVEQREYQISSIKDTVDRLNKGKDVLINLPTGAGKTVIYAPIAVEVSKNGGRALVLTATKQAQRRVDSEIKRFDQGSNPSLVFGVQSYQCPILEDIAQNWCCGELKEEYCKPNGIKCAVIAAESDYKTQNLVITNFSKFLLAASDSDYHVIVIDDSHSFINAKEQAFQISVDFSLVRKLYNSGIRNNEIKSLVETFLNIFAQIFERCVSPGADEGLVSQEFIIHLSELVPDEREKEVRSAIASSGESDRSTLWNVFYFIRRCKSSSKYRFYIRTDYYDREDIDSSELISRRDDLVDFIIRKRFGNARVMFITATPGDPTLHASSCTLRDYGESGIETTPPADAPIPEIDNWFEKLIILIVSDLGDTRKDEYLERAISLTTEILKHRTERALVLFRNYRDQRRANDYLSKIFSADKLFFIDSSIQDKDIIQEIADRSRISLASASSTLWEGINIKELRLAVIVSPPFIRPSVGQSVDYPYWERRMLVRLQQGIGRIIRNQNDFGVAILPDIRFKKYITKSAFGAKLRERAEYLQSDQVLPRIDEAFSEWSNM